VKGKRRPVEAFAVGPARGSRAEVAAADLPIVGRDDELARVARVLDGARSGNGGVVEIVGDAGSGKTRFLRELERRAAPIVTWRAQCRLYQAATPYFPVRQLLDALVPLDDDAPERALDELVARVAPDLRPWLSLLGVAFGLDLADSEEAAALDESFRKQRLEDAVVELVAAIATDSTIFVFEDTHWMDDASGDLVRALARAAPEQSWMVCTTRRPTASGLAFDGEDGVDSIVLEPLDGAATAKLVVAATSDAPVPQHVAQEIARRSDGNPLFLLELLAALREGGDLSSLPTTVEGLISARVDRLPPEDRARLRRVSVLGAGFAVEHLGAVDGVEDAGARPLTRLADFLAIDAGGWVTFRHALVRDVAYGGLPYETRRQLHGQVADSILRTAPDADAAAALLSLHFFHAQRYEETWRYACIAGDTAREMYANVEAATLYTRALASARQGASVTAAEHVAVLESLGDVQDRAGLFAEARAAYAAARKELGDDRVAVGRVLLKEAFIAERRGRYTEAVRSIRRAEREIEPENDASSDQLRAQLLVWLAVIRAKQGLLRRAVAAAYQGIELAEAADDQAARARAFLVLDVAESALGLSHDFRRTMTALEIYVDSGDIAGESTAANNLGLGAYDSGRWEEAVRWYESSRTATLRLGDPVNAALNDANIAEILGNQGRFAAAEDLLKGAEATWIAAQDPWGVAFARLLLGTVAARAGRAEDADELLTAAREGFEQIGARFDVVATDLALVEAHLRAGDGATALAIVTRLDEAPGASEQLGPPLQAMHGRALLQTGAAEPAGEVLERALSSARASGNDYHLLLVLDALDAARSALGTGLDPSERDEAAEIVRRLDIVLLPAYPAGERASC
jgi:tetratricopeptide (TPR) repeat protein